MKKFFCVLCSLVIVSSLVTLPVKAEAKESGYDDYVEEYGCRVSEMTEEQLIDYFDLEFYAKTNDIDLKILAKNTYEGIRLNRVSPYTDNLPQKLDQPKILATYSHSPVYSQDSTMYLETGNNCASGNYPYIGCVAVHKKSSSNANPIIPFGTRINYIGSSVTIGGSSYNSFIVEDTGDPSFVRTTYWTDVYGGANNTTNYRNALNYGVKKVTIQW